MSDHHYRETQRALARYLIENRRALPQTNWTAQGFGFLRLRVNATTRLHIWHSRLRVPGVSDIHDHAQWSFTSRILSGQLVNLRFEESTGNDARYYRGVIRCGIGGGMSDAAPEPIDLLATDRPELYEAGQHYHQAASEIHRTYAQDGTVTLITQERHDTDTARVYWPYGTKWVDAIPRQATFEEIDEIGAYALAMFE